MVGQCDYALQGYQHFIVLPNFGNPSVVALLLSGLNDNQLEGASYATSSC